MNSQNTDSPSPAPRPQDPPVRGLPNQADYAVGLLMKKRGAVILGYPPHTDPMWLPAIGSEVREFGGTRLDRWSLTVTALATRNEWDGQFAFLFQGLKANPAKRGSKFFRCTAALQSSRSPVEKTEGRTGLKRKVSDHA